MRNRFFPVATIGVLLLGGCGTDVAGPSSSLFACLFTEPRVLAVGEAVDFDGPGNRSVCLSGGTDGATFLYVPFVGMAPAADDDPGPAMGLRVMGAGVAPPTGVSPAPAAPLPGLGRSDTPRLGHGLHQAIRQREIQELTPLLRGPHPGGEAPTTLAVPSQTPPVVGEELELNVALSCSREDLRHARVMAVSERSVILAESEFASRLATAHYEQFAAAFDDLVYPVSVRHFGEPTDIDDNERILILFTSAVNGLNPLEGAITAGVFWAGDLFPATATSRLQACPGGNQAEIFYLAVPDGDGALGPQVPASWLVERGVQIMGHEFQHLLNAARRIHVNEAPVFEQVWLNEGLSHIAEELLFFEESGLPRGENLTWSRIQSTPGAALAYERYMGGNHFNLQRFLVRPDTTSPMGRDGLATRGAAWSFLRYAADRKGAGDEALFHPLVNSTRAGVENLDRALAGSALRWMQDWAVSLYADDHVPGLEARHGYPSWSLRDIWRIPGGGYHLRPSVLGTGTATDLSLLPGGAGFLAFGIEAGGRAAIHVEAGGTTPPRTVRGALLRVR